jgi:hypothetical protein
MKPILRPTRLEERLREPAVEVHRNLYCPHYDSCLELAVQAGWESWTCARCPQRSLGSQGPQTSAYAFASRDEER